MEPLGDCLVWTGADNGKGYGRIYVATINGRKVFEYTHKLGHILRTSEPIPKGFEIDHTCHDPNVCKLLDSCPHRRCVLHTELVTHQENARRQMRDRCPYGHEWTESNTYTSKQGKRVCRACGRRRAAERRARRR